MPAGTFAQYALPGKMVGDGGITVGSDGALWLLATDATQDAQNAIWRVTPGGAATMEYSIAPDTIDLNGQVTTGSDGAIWFYGVRGGIGRITTSGSVHYFALPSDSLVFAMTTGPDGAVWFTDTGTSSLGRITTAGTITEYPTALLANVSSGIVTGSDGALWFTNSGFSASANNIIGRYSPSTGFRSFPVSSGSQPYAIAAGPDGALWFTEDGTNRIGRITTAGAYTEYALPPGYANPSAITRGPDNALWFLTGEPIAAIGEITTTGSISMTPVPVADFPSTQVGITATSDGSLWFGGLAGLIRFRP